MSGRKSSVKKAAVPKRQREDEEEEEGEADKPSYAETRLQKLADPEEQDKARPWPFQLYTKTSFEKATHYFQGKFDNTCERLQWKSGRPKLPWTPHEDAILVQVLYQMRMWYQERQEKGRYIVSACQSPPLSLHYSLPIPRPAGSSQLSS
jgi:hypothetical protein